MKLNEDKCHLKIFGAKGSNETTIKIVEACVKESSEENLLGITFNQSLSFKQHFKTVCKKTIRYKTLQNDMIMLKKHKISKRYAA